MSWERDPLWAKAKLFFGKAAEGHRDDPAYGLWCSFGLEALARAAIASVSPALLAEPDKDQLNLLFALGKYTPKGSPKSIGAATVFKHCDSLFEDFTPDMVKTSIALLNRRNEELHTGTAAFEAYPAKQWLSSLYRACDILCRALGEDLDGLFGSDEAEAAREIIDETKNEVRSHVLSEIAAYKKVFDAKDEAERAELVSGAEHRMVLLVYERHHKVECPACGSDASVQGKEFGPSRTQLSDEETEIVEKRSVTPQKFDCRACGLKLSGYAQLEAANLGGQYTRTTRYEIADYYGLVDPESLVEDGREYDNE